MTIFKKMEIKAKALLLIFDWIFAKESMSIKFWTKNQFLKNWQFFNQIEVHKFKMVLEICKAEIVVVFM